MTTTVLVKANHGWPVRVIPVTADGGLTGPVQMVEPDHEGSFSVHSGQDLLIHEVQPDAAPKTDAEHILQFFAFAHLPDHLAVVSRPFAMIANRIVATVPRNPERTVALRKLLEAKDAAVRAMVAR